MLLDAKQVAGSLTKALDILYVLHGAKPAARVLYDDDVELLTYLEKQGLHYALSEFKIAVQADDTRSYTDKGVRVSVNAAGHHFLYVAKDKNVALQAMTLEKEGDHLAFGELLGYPRCCCEFFHSAVQKSASLDLTPATFASSPGMVFPWQLNTCLRGFDISLISHFPCSFGCKQSLAIAERNLELIRKMESDVATYFSHALKSAVLYAQGVGVYSFPHFKLEGNVLQYLPQTAIVSMDNELSEVIKKEKSLTILGRNAVKIGSTLVEDAQTFFAIFS